MSINANWIFFDNPVSIPIESESKTDKTPLLLIFFSVSVCINNDLNTYLSCNYYKKITTLNFKTIFIPILNLNCYIMYNFFTGDFEFFSIEGTNFLHKNQKYIPNYPTLFTNKSNRWLTITHINMFIVNQAIFLALKNSPLP
ncbi:hypothetical protein CRENPOLYSF2_2530015 [Crenothrix polyspora]|uniref:Uncharacterized protein n=1 Tax=Crenothrix polyspora TaxID=360316 RepID=A0A1R4H7C6_9GAMM|nr:hypothetical protein CRENPOLYSF2_2530015 [Crenothrix polyspora]